MDKDRILNKNKPDISVVIPVYKSEKTVRALFDRLTSSLGKITSDYEIIMVEDGGEDGSWNVIVELSSSDERLRGIKLSRNYGQHNALLCGILAARKNIIVTMDDDLQNPPEEIEKLVSKLNEGYDVVYGSPQAEQHDLWRRTTSKMIKFSLQAVLGFEIGKNASAFRAFRARIRNAFKDYSDSIISIDILLSWGTAKFATVPVRHAVRQGGKSNYSFVKLCAHALNMITGFSVLPLHIASFCGMVSVIFGVIVLVYVVGRYFLIGYSEPGFPFIASTIAIFAGAQLLCLGIIGEYIARIHFRSMKKLPYMTLTTTDEEKVKIKSAESGA